MKVTINEAVGVHYRCETKHAPEVGALAMLRVGRQQIPLVVRCVTPLKTDKDVALVQAFVIEKGTYRILQEAKGNEGEIEW